MQLNVPSRTALRVAMRRAAHQVHDPPPLVFDDEFAMRILPMDAQAEVRESDKAHDALSRGLRSWMVVRSRFAEDQLAEAVGAGARQYVLLGAGLDTFSWRNPFSENLTVFEVDHPATQSWKRALAAGAGLGEPRSTRYVPVDFEQDSLADRLRAAGFRTNERSCFSWLGVVPYLTLASFRETLRFLGQCAAGSRIVFDYALPVDALSEAERPFFEFMAARVAQSGEPFQLFFRPEEMAAELRNAGWQVDADLNGGALHDLYLAGRAGGLGLKGRVGRLITAARQPDNS